MEKRWRRPEWLQSGSCLVLRQGERKGFLGPELQNLVT